MIELYNIDMSGNITVQLNKEQYQTQELRSATNTSASVTSSTSCITPDALIRSIVQTIIKTTKEITVARHHSIGKMKIDIKKFTTIETETKTFTLLQGLKNTTRQKWRIEVARKLHEIRQKNHKYHCSK